MTKRKLHIILAGNYTQARAYIATKNLKMSECRIPTTREAVMGLEGFTLHHIGTWATDLDGEIISEATMRAMRK